MAALSAMAGPLSLHDPRKITAWYSGAAPAVAAWAAICGRRSVPIHLLVRCERLPSGLREQNTVATLVCSYCCVLLAIQRSVNDTWSLIRCVAIVATEHCLACCRMWKRGCIDRWMKPELCGVIPAHRRTWRWMLTRRSKPQRTGLRGRSCSIANKHMSTYAWHRAFHTPPAPS